MSGPACAQGVRGLPMTPAGWFSAASRPTAQRADLAKIAVKNHHNGTLAPKSMLKGDHCRARAPIIVAVRPLRLLRAVGRRAAAILTKRELAKSFRDDFALVKAVAIAPGDPQNDPSFDFLRWKPTVSATAGLRAGRHLESFKELDIAQVHDCFTLTEL
jgi:acetyl-CoA C-acetyltransferase